eukprot:TRINITY_DN11315_c0_g2_i2.p1 TRINITY_DN11315_c0_g2~~TRINITY_DN11315_c0_g2_i2.p1  ORF type:complete len:181 (+),score=36.02 TRINITY_DN11315_c0_g2_i2:73-615(+)
MCIRDSVIAYIEIASAVLAVVFVIFSSYYNVYYTLSTILRIFAVIPGALCYHAVKKYSTVSASVTYHWKIWEPLILGVLRLVGLVREIVDRLGEDSVGRVVWLILGTSALVIASIVYAVYACYILYSFMQLVRANNRELIFYGPDILKEMMRVRMQAEIIGMQPVIPMQTFEQVDIFNKI